MSSLLLSATNWMDVTLNGAVVTATNAASEFNTGSGQWNFTGSQSPNTKVIRYSATPGTGDVLTMSMSSPIAGARVRVWLNSWIDKNNKLNVQSIGGTSNTIDQLPTPDFDQTLVAGTNYSFTSQTGIGNAVVMIDTATSGSTNLNVSLTPLQQVLAPVANYSYQTGGSNGLTVTFTDTSTQQNGTVQSWNWAFGDGQTSTDQNPAHAYTAAGQYSVTLTVVGTNGMSAAVTQVLNIPKLAASFSWTSLGLVASFKSTSVTAPAYSINSYYWDFGDGTTLAGSTANPTHTYSAPGTYNVSLTVQDTSGTGTSTTYTHAVTVASNGNASVPPSVSFTAEVSNLAATFKDLSTSEDSTVVGWLWAFGDGVTSTDQNPSHSYATAGTYTVSLTATDALGVSSTGSKAIVTTAPSGSGTEGDTATYVLKGFISIPTLADNSVNVVAPIGEVSVYSRTFSRDQGIYSLPLSMESAAGGVDMELLTFSSIDKDGNAATVPTDYASATLSISEWLYVQAINGVLTSDASAALALIQTTFGSAMKSAVVGPMVQSGTMWMPSSLDFYFNAASTIQPGYTSNSRVKVWYADANFRNEYDKFELDYVPPITPLDTFFKDASLVEAAVKNRTLQQLMASIKQVINDQPPTLVDSLSFNWHDPNNSNNLVPTDWTYILYGPAGNNIDSIKQGLQAYILANSSHNSAEWAKIFPDIFATTEYICCPLWTQYAIPNKTDAAGMPSPTVNPNQALQYMLATAVGTGYTTEYVTNYQNILPVAFRAMSTVIVGGPQNEGGVYEFAKQWPDYLDVNTSSTDFDRMQVDTQTFVGKFQSLLLAAETMTATSDLPDGITRVQRTNSSGDVITYAVMTYNNINYLCVTKDFMISKYGASTNTTASIALGYDGIYANGAYQLLSSVPTMNLQFLTTNGTLPLQYTLIDTTASNASINAETGLLTATFPAAGFYTVTLKVVDAQGHSAQQTFTFKFQSPTTTTTALGITNSTMPANGYVGVSYSGTALVSGGTAPYLIDNSTLPDGLTASISGSTLTVSGSPTGPSTTTANISVQDSAQGTPAKASLSWSLDIEPAPETVSNSLTFDDTNTPNQATVGDAYSASGTIVGGTPPYTVTSNTTLPTGLSAAITGSALTVSGTPTVAGSSWANVEVKDASSNPVNIGQMQWPVTVSAASSSTGLQFVQENLPSATRVNAAYLGTANITGGTAPYSVVSSSVPDGLTVSVEGSTIAISGRPTTEHDDTPFSVDIKVSDSTSGTALTGDLTYDLTVYAALQS